MEPEARPIKFDKLDRIKSIYYIRSHREPAKKIFVRLFRPYRDLFSFKNEEDKYEAIASLFITFGTAMLLDRHMTEKDFDVNNNMDYTLMYGIVDHYLDSDSISVKEKEMRVAIIKDIIYNEAEPEDMSEPIEILYNIFQKHKHRENVVKYIKKAFEAEYKSYKIQYGNYDEDVYRKVCGDKGSTMYYLHKAINDLEVDEEHDFWTGMLGQVYDDCSDADNDNRNNIRTLATYVLEKEGNLDRLFHESLDMIKKLPDPEYSLYRGVMIILGFHIVNESPHFSDKLKRKARPYSLIFPGVKINQVLGKSLCEMMYD